MLSCSFVRSIIGWSFVNGFSEETSKSFSFRDLNPSRAELGAKSFKRRGRPSANLSEVELGRRFKLSCTLLRDTVDCSLALHSDQLRRDQAKAGANLSRISAESITSSLK